MKAKDVRGFVIKTTRYSDKHTQPTCVWEDCRFVDGWNQAIDQQGERDINLNREKTVEIIFDRNGRNKKAANEIYNALIAALPDLLESKTKDEKWKRI